VRPRLPADASPDGVRLERDRGTTRPDARGGAPACGARARRNRARAREGRGVSRAAAGTGQPLSAGRELMTWLRDLIAKVIRVDGTEMVDRRALHLEAGPGVTLEAQDRPAQHETRVKISMDGVGGEIDGSKLADGSVTGGKIASGTAALGLVLRS